ncbi:tolA protein [alpha proteobacterium U9-1i]|nr:tolA protein [alpha proteobacterium U9-1i]
MTATLLLIAAVQLVAFGVGFALLWRKLGRTENELLRLRRVVESMELDRAVPKRSRAKAEAALAVGGQARARAPEPDVDLEWRAPVSRLRPETPPLVVVDDHDEEPSWFNPARQFIAIAVALAALPLAGLPFGLTLAELTPAGLLIAAALAFAGLREDWNAAAWVAAAAGIGWAAAALTTGDALVAPALFSASAALAGAGGLTHLVLRESQRGAVLAAGMSVALLWLCAIAGVIGPAGLALASLIIASALLGARKLRFEPMLHAAFAAAGVALFVLSAQESAAIWFTPAAALAGMLFLAIAFVRVPQLGARGGSVAGAGAAASMFAVGALYVSQHGLANPWAASAGFVALAGAFGGIIALAAQRRGRDVQRLKLTLWVLGFSAFAALASAIFIVAPPPLAATLMAALALGFAALDLRVPTLAWRAAAIASLVVAALAASTSAQSFASAFPIWPRWALLIAAFAAPAALAAAAAYLARPRARLSADVYETFAILGAIGAGALALRLAFTAATPEMLTLSFLEAGAQIALLSLAALALAANNRRELGGLAFVLALALGAVASTFWLTPHWLEQPLATLAPYGFALMAAPLWAHWAFWRSRAAHTRTRVSFSAAALASAAFVTLEIVNARDAIATPGVDWLTVGASSLAFAIALGGSFAPHVVSSARPRYLRRR